MPAAGAIIAVYRRPIAEEKKKKKKKLIKIIISNSEFGTPPPNQNMITNTAHTAVGVHTSDLSLIPLPSALFTTRSVRHGTRVTPASSCSPPPPGHLHDNSSLPPGGVLGKPLPISTAGDYVQVGRSPKPPLHLDETGPSQASCVQMGWPKTPHETRLSAREKRYSEKFWHVPTGCCSP